MEDINTNEIRSLMTVIAGTMSEVDNLKSKYQYATGEVKDAYGLIYRDHLWQLQKKIGQLWYYVCGAPIVPIAEILAS